MSKFKRYSRNTRVHLGCFDYKFENSPAQKPELRLTLRGCNSAVSSLCFASNRQHILGSANDYAARIWDLSTGKVLKTLTGHTGAVTATRYLTPTSVVTGSSDRTLRVWDLNKIACIKTLWPSSKGLIGL